MHKWIIIGVNMMGKNKKNQEIGQFRRVAWGIYKADYRIFEVDFRKSKKSRKKTYHSTIFCNLKNREAEIERKVKTLICNNHYIESFQCCQYGIKFISVNDDELATTIGNVMSMLIDNGVDNQCSYCREHQEQHATYRRYKEIAYYSCDDCSSKIKKQIDTQYEKQNKQRNRNRILALILQPISMFLSFEILYIATKATINWIMLFSLLFIMAYIIPQVIRKMTNDGNLIMIVGVIWSVWLIVLSINVIGWVGETYNRDLSRYNQRIEEVKTEYKEITGFEYSGVWNEQAARNADANVNSNSGAEINNVSKKIKNAYKNLNKLNEQYSNYKLPMEVIMIIVLIAMVLMNSYNEADDTALYIDDDYIEYDDFDDRIYNTYYI